MRFTCQNCSAKYQIADEKVAGKTVRMKCRKCGNLIQVRADGAPGSVSPVHMPPTPRPSGVGATPPHAVQHAGPHAGPHASPSWPGTPPPAGHGAPPARGSGVGYAPPRPSGSPFQPPAAGPPRPSVATRGSSPGSPPRPAPPRPGSAPTGASGVATQRGVAPAAPRGLSGASAGMSARGATARAGQSPPIGAAAAARIERPNEQVLPEEEGEAATIVMMRPSVDDLEPARAPRPAAGAPFPSVALSPSVAPASIEPPTTPIPPKKPAQPELSPKVEWYVGIDGEPVGPVDQAYIKTQLDAGKVSPTSLVWREEMTDWVALNALPAMRALVPPKPVPADQRSDPLALDRRAGQEPLSSTLAIDPGPGTKPSAQLSSPAAAISASVSPHVGPLSVPAKSRDPMIATELAPTPAPIPIVRTDFGAPHGFQAEAPVARDSVTSSGGAVAPHVVEPPPASEDLAELAGLPVERRRKRRGVNPMAYAFIAMATAFGAVSAWFLFGQKNDDDRPVAELGPSATPQVGAEGELPPPPPPSADPAPDGSGEVDNENPGQPRPYGTLPSIGSGEKPEPKSTGSAKPCDPDDPLCANNVKGPTEGKGSTGDTEGGQGLSQAQASNVVAQYKGSLMRKCRALVTKGGAKVAATITVGSSGAVQNVSASGGNEYPGLAGCVSSRIRNWTFPASGGSTTVNVSFNFL